MTIAEAAEKVITDENRALQAREIAEIITKRGLYVFRAKDPASVVSSALNTHIAKRGAACAIEKPKPGLFSAKRV